MTHHDKVMEIMRRDPSRTYTASDIAVAIWGEGDRHRRVGTAGRVLLQAQKYGFVECIGTENGARLWRLVA